MHIRRHVPRPQTTPRMHIRTCILRQIRPRAPKQDAHRHQLRTDIHAPNQAPQPTACCVLSTTSARSRMASMSSSYSRLAAAASSAASSTRSKSVKHCEKSEGRAAGPHTYDAPPQATVLKSQPQI